MRLPKRINTPTTFYNAETLTVYWETSPEVIRSILPAPLTPGPRPLVHAFCSQLSPHQLLRALP
ncbi:acetoacetate decarboxylase family protein [Paenibacillus rhizoplanae]